VTFNNGDGEQRRGSAAPHVLQLTAVGWSHPTWPALIYYSAVPLQVSDPAASVEAMFDRNAWPAHWRNGVYSFHHYHSNAHEVLGFAAGEAHLMLGGPNGSEVTVRAGDVVVLPAGTGHFRIDASRNLLVVGSAGSKGRPLPRGRNNKCARPDRATAMPGYRSRARNGRAADLAVACQWSMKHCQPARGRRRAALWPSVPPIARGRGTGCWRGSTVERGERK
jgi:uncharacterized protein YjlB